MHNRYRKDMLQRYMLNKLGIREVREDVPELEEILGEKLEDSIERSRGMHLRDGECLFLVGMPASGKSTVKNKIKGMSGGIEVVDIDPDEIKLRHDEYSYEGYGWHVHAWSKQVAHNTFTDVIESKGKPCFIWDTTGANKDELCLKINQSRRRGYKVKIALAIIPREVAIWRNRRRDRYEGDELFLYNDALKLVLNSLKHIMSKSHISRNDVYVYSEYESRDVDIARDEIREVPIDKYEVRPIYKERVEHSRGGVTKYIKSYEDKRSKILSWMESIGKESMTWKEFIKLSESAYEYMNDYSGDKEELKQFLKDMKPCFTLKIQLSNIQESGDKHAIVRKDLARLGVKQACIKRSW